VSENVTGCVVHSKPTEARHGLLCVAHFDRLADMLREIEEEAAILSAVPSMAIRTGSGGGSLASERAPARLDVLAFRDPQTRRWTRDAMAKHPLPSPKAFGPWCLFCEHETCTDWRAGRRRDLHDDEHDAGSERVMSILGVLHGWARVTREERDLTSPDQITISSERRALTHHLEWLAEQPFIDEMFSEIRQLVSALKDLNGTQAEKPIGRCYLPSETGVCAGPIWVDEAMGTASCGRCRASWTGYQITVLNYELEKIKAEKARPKTDDGRRMLTAQEMADRLGTSIANVRKMASRQGIRAVRGHYDPDRFKSKAVA
jgi:hypothetical protein